MTWRRPSGVDGQVAKALGACFAEQTGLQNRRAGKKHALSFFPVSFAFRSENLHSEITVNPAGTGR
jgi:hypothetical protein